MTSILNTRHVHALSHSVVSRRSVLAGGAGTVAISAMTAAGCSVRSAPTRFVLVHGAWHGGWCWRRVADELTAKGHKVFAPTLSGLCERSHLLGDSVNLTTHVNDIANEIRWKDLEDIVLVGHSYGGMVITGVAEQVLANIASIVYLDAFLPNDGQSVADIVGDQTPALTAPGIAALPAAAFNVNSADAAWVDGKMTPQPVATFTERLRVSGAFARVRRKAFIGVTIGESPFFQAVADRYAANSDWRVRTIDCGHDAMIDKPKELAAMLEELA